jgi:hypothetical protein
MRYCKCYPSSQKYEEVSTIFGTGAAICTSVAVVRCNGWW